MNQALSPIVRIKDGVKIYEYDSVVSTMDVARSYESKLSPEETCVISARHQTQGRGRQGKAWVNAHESILLTVILPSISFKDMSGYSLVVGVGIIEALSLQTRKTKLKWPNDIYFEDGKKIGGILIEVSDRILVGIGLNLKGAPRWGMSLDNFGLTDRTTIEDSIITRILEESRVFANVGFQPFKKSFESLDYLRGRHVVCTQSDTTGICNGVDDDGALLVNSSNGIVRVVAGSVEVH